MTGGLAEPGPELAWRNRRILAERLGWPAGVLQACEDLEVAHPHWSITWQRAHTVETETTPGFVAVDRRSDQRHRVEVFSPFAAALDRELVRRETTGPLTGGQHEPGRPHQDCVSCGYPSPCPAEKQLLLADMHPVELAELMQTRLGEAAHDLPDEPAEKLFDRFIAWTGPAL